MICVKLNRIAWVLVQLITSLLWKSLSAIRFKPSLRDSIRQLMSPEEPEAVESSENKSRKYFNKFLKYFTKKMGPYYVLRMIVVIRFYQNFDSL